MPRPGRRQQSDLYEHFSVLDIGTEYVKALVVRRESVNGIVLGAARQRQALTAMNGGVVADIEAVVEGCNAALEAAEDLSEAIPGQAVVGIAGEMVKGFATSVAYPRPDGEGRITESELQRVLELVQRRALRQAAAELSHEAGANIEVKLVHSAITSVRIDGHRVTNPLGFQGRNMEVSVFNTFAPLTHIGALESVAAELDLEMLSLVAEPYAVARCCMREEVHEQGGIFIDIGGGTTDVALVRSGGIESTRMFALGGRTFTRRVMGELGLRYGQSEEAKLRYSEGRLPAEQVEVLRGPFQRDTRLLVDAVALVLEEMAHGHPLPRDIYLCGGGSALPEVQATMEAYAWADRLPFAGHPTVTRLRPADVAGVYDSTGLLLSEQDVTPMALAFHGLHREEEGELLLGQLMKRIMKVMKV
ncbi:MAG: cell division FtsA domain-containing protein [Candidatus Dormibacteria bacterium]